MFNPLQKAVDEVHYLIEFLEKCRSSLVNITKIDFYNSIEADQKFSTLHEAEKLANPCALKLHFSALYDYYKKAKKRSVSSARSKFTFAVGEMIEVISITF